MGRLAERKNRLRFETDTKVFDRGHYREVIAEPTAHLMYVRLKGSRRSLPVSYQTIYELANKIEANRVRQEKLAKKAGKK